MKKNIVITTIFLILIWYGATNFSAATLSQVSDSILSNKKSVDSTLVSKSIYTKDNTSELSLFVNGLNNIITTYGIVLCIITVLIAIAGFFSIKTIMNKLDDYKEKTRDKEKLIDDKLIELNKYKEQYIANIESINQLKHQLNIQNKYIEKATTYIYFTLDKDAEKKKDRVLKSKLITEKQILQLFYNNKKGKEAALLYFSQYGTIEHLPDIKYVAENDLDEDIRKLALKIIGRIEGREDNGHV
jgi:hypothetical protein